MDTLRHDCFEISLAATRAGDASYIAVDVVQEIVFEALCVVIDVVLAIGVGLHIKLELALRTACFSIIFAVKVVATELTVLILAGLLDTGSFTWIETSAVRLTLFS